jgi:hypothetical protein
MHRSSESIAALAAALAKAQIELVNPEKSLSATIYLERGAKERTFRYAALASGLDIVRKTLGRHELAVIQTTQPDPERGIIELNTILAHASGEWIASDWPVCSMADVNSPRRMGAALTYARRYSLFTLVGIAGEDDLDAPDLIPPLSPAAQSNGGDGARLARQDKKYAAPVREILDAERSAARRDQLIQEIAALPSQAKASDWAVQALRSKNSLRTADAQSVEAVFAARLVVLAPAGQLQPPDDNGSNESNGHAAEPTIATADGKSIRRKRSSIRRKKTPRVSSIDRKPGDKARVEIVNS